MPIKVLLFEWLSSGGLHFDDQFPDLSCSMQRQGLRMLEAVAQDFSNAGASVSVPIDSRSPGFEIENVETTPIFNRRELASVLEKQANESDAILIIAPETDRCLLNVLGWLKPHHSKLISPNVEFVELASNKSLTCEHLANAGILVPGGERLTEKSWKRTLATFPLPYVLKRNDGAGSEDVFHFTHRSAIESLPIPKMTPDRFRIERFVSGTPVSVGVIGRPSGQYTLLEPSRQRFDRAPIGAYVESKFDLSEVLSDRATRLAARVAQALPKTTGYFGIDMILDTSSTSDVVIEINPRITTSYCQIRTRSDVNLATMFFDSKTFLRPRS